MSKSAFTDKDAEMRFNMGVYKHSKVTSSMM